MLRMKKIYQLKKQKLYLAFDDGYFHKKESGKGYRETAKRCQRFNYDLLFNELPNYSGINQIPKFEKNLKV